MPLETLRLAFTSIRRNALRSILTLLGVTIGVAAVIAMITLGRGTSTLITSSITSLGSNMLIVTPGRLEDGGYGSSSFRIADAEAIERQVGEIKAVAPLGSRTLTAVYGSTNHLTTVDGADNRFFEVTNWALAEGRLFRDGELVSGATVCILGHEVASKLFGTEDPLDKVVRLKKIACRVIGILEKKGAGMFGGNQDDIVLMPLRTFQRRIAGNSDVVVMYVAAESEQAITRVQDAITALLRERRHLSAIESNDFSVTDMRQISSMLETVTGVLTGLLAAVAGISLLVGGIGIMNIMLVSVTERTHEIGIRLAIGAREVSGSGAIPDRGDHPVDDRGARRYRPRSRRGGWRRIPPWRAVPPRPVRGPSGVRLLRDRGRRVRLLPGARRGPSRPHRGPSPLMSRTTAPFDGHQVRRAAVPDVAYAPLK